MSIGGVAGTIGFINNTLSTASQLADVTPLLQSYQLRKQQEAFQQSLFGGLLGGLAGGGLGGGFGAPPPQPFGGGGFGLSPASQSSFGAGLLGGGFAAPQQPNPFSLGGGFGVPQAQPAGGGFGATGGIQNVLGTLVQALISLVSNFR